MTSKAWVRALLCLLIVSLCFSVTATEPFVSQLNEDMLLNHPLFEAYYNEHLESVAYYPSLPEEDLVALGSAYLAPLIIFEEEQAKLLLNAIVASPEIHFGFERISFDFTEEDAVFDVTAHDASADEFYADEVYLPVEQQLLDILLLIANNPDEELHVTFWGQGKLSLHFALTHNQIHTIQDYLTVFLGEGGMETFSI